MPTILECKECGKKYYTANSIEEGKVSGFCDECQGQLVSLGFPGYDAMED